MNADIHNSQDMRKNNDDLQDDDGDRLRGWMVRNEFHSFFLFHYLLNLF